MTRFVGIDPSTKTGFVALDEHGVVVRAKELTGLGSQDPKRMVTLISDIIAHVQLGDIICIEGFPFSTQRAMFAGGLHHGIRNELFKRNFKYYEVAPNAVKKFVNVTGWVGEEGHKVRLKDKEKKIAVMDAVKEIFGFSSSNDNIVDAYIMAEIARCLKLGAENITRHKFQLEVIDTILHPEEKPKKKKKAK